LVQRRSGIQSSSHPEMHTGRRGRRADRDGMGGS
jgi:hypothetical protein